MAAADFTRSLKLVLVDEGGLSDDPHDHGGRTAHGITQREYTSWLARHGQASKDVWKITPAELTAIYHDSYWEPGCDEMPAGFDYVFFDFRVNAGPVQAVRTLQSVLGIRVDGHLGDVTLNAVKAADVDDLIHKYCAARRAFYQHLAQFPRYGRGWLARTNHAEAAAMQIAASGQAERVGLSDELRSLATARANAFAVVQPPMQPGTAGGLAGSSGIAAGLLNNLQDAASQLQPFQFSFQFVEYALVAIAIISVGFAIYGTVKQGQVKRAIA